MNIVHSLVMASVKQITQVSSTFYGVDVYREPVKPSLFEKFLKYARIGTPILLVIIGLFVLFNKKIAKKTKAIVVSVILALAAVSFFVINYFYFNY